MHLCQNRSRTSNNVDWATQGPSWGYLNFGDECPQNGSKNDPMVPRTTLGCPHEGPRVVRPLSDAGRNDLKGFQHFYLKHSSHQRRNRALTLSHVPNSLESGPAFQRRRVLTAIHPHWEQIVVSKIPGLHGKSTRAGGTGACGAGPARFRSSGALMRSAV